MVVQPGTSFTTTFSLSVEYRNVTLADVTRPKFEDKLAVSAESIEFNVLGMAHEFWIASQSGVIIGLTILAKEKANSNKIPYLEVAPS